MEKNIKMYCQLCINHDITFSNSNGCSLNLDSTPNTCPEFERTTKDTKKGGFMIKACLIVGHVAYEFKDKVPYSHKLCFVVTLTGDKKQDDEKIVNALYGLKGVNVNNIYDKFFTSIIEIDDDNFEQLMLGKEINVSMKLRR